MYPNCSHAGAARNKQTHNREECVCQKSDFLIFVAPLEDCHSSLVDVTCTLHCYMSLIHPYLHYHHVTGAGTPPPIMVRTKKKLLLNHDQVFIHDVPPPSISSSISISINKDDFEQLTFKFKCMNLNAAFLICIAERRSVLWLNVRWPLSGDALLHNGCTISL